MEMLRMLMKFGLCVFLFLILVVLEVNYSSQLSQTISTPVEPLHTTGFVVRLKVGQSRVDQYLYLDTGSSLTWIHCRPNSLNAKNPEYDSKKSSSYKAEDCVTSDFCFEGCDEYKRCAYYKSYASGQSSKGVLSRDTFVLEVTHSSWLGRDEVILEDFLFGCSKATTLLSDGILGLGYSKSSLLAQMSSTKFSYCLGDMRDVNYDNRLIIGDSSKKRLRYEIPMIVYGKYYIDITSIDIGEVNLDTNVLIRDVDKYTGGMAVDTGSTLTHFPRALYYQFASAIRKLVDLRSFERFYRDNPDELCYLGRFDKDLVRFPIVRFWFGKVAYMEFRTNNLFRQVRENSFCLAFLPWNNSLGVFGVFQQQGYYISFDIQASTFSFEELDCSTIDKNSHDEL